MNKPFFSYFISQLAFSYGEEGGEGGVQILFASREKDEKWEEGVEGTERGKRKRSRQN